VYQSKTERKGLDDCVDVGVGVGVWCLVSVLMEMMMTVMESLDPGGK